MNKETIKQALISILIGASIAILTVIFQELVNYLKGFENALPGVIVGIIHHLKSWKLHQIG